MIIKAAIMFSNGEVVEGRDYGTIATIANKLSFTGERIFGFITGTGDFVLPAEAADIALRDKQIENDIKELKPEDLWPSYAVE